MSRSLSKISSFGPRVSATATGIQVVFSPGDNIERDGVSIANNSALGSGFNLAIGFGEAPDATHWDALLLPGEEGLYDIGANVPLFLGAVGGAATYSCKQYERKA